MQTVPQTVPLSAEVRSSSGKGHARKLRKTGRLPGVVYRGGGEALSIAFNPTELEARFAETGDPNTLVDVQLDDDSNRVCLVKDVQRHPVSKEIRHVDFYEIDPDEAVTVNVLVRPLGEAIGVKMGGILRLICRTLPMTCLPADIPKLIEIDVSEMNLGDFVKISHLPMPTGCKVHYTTDFNVLAVVGRRGGALDDEDDDQIEGDEHDDDEDDGE